jgi:hypothetical protein
MIMKADDFRRIALSMPEACEKAHMGHADFRVAEKIFATLGYPDERFGVVMLPPEEQERVVRAHPTAFTPAKGSWGLRGNTKVLLQAIDSATLQSAMAMAWRKTAPARLLKKPKIVKAPGLKKRPRAR